MSFELFTEVPEKRFVGKQLQAMFNQLKPGMYAICDLDYDYIQQFAQRHDIKIKLRRLKSGKIKVRRLT